MSVAFFLIVSLVWSALVALAADKLTGDGSDPHFAQSVWRGAAGLMVLPWFVAAIAHLSPSIADQLPLADALAESGDALTGAVGGLASAPLAAASPGLGVWLTYFLGVGWATRLAFALLAQIRLQTIKSAAAIDTDPCTIAAIAHWSTCLGLAQPPRLKRLNTAGSPFVSGVLSRTIHLPNGVAAANASLISAHECVHVARGDLITRPLERLVADILFFSPFAWLARRRLDHLREAVCDIETVRLTKEPIGYARALTDAARRGRRSDSLPVSTLVPRNSRSLHMRINAIVKPASEQQRSRAGLAVAAFLTAAPIAFAQGAAARPEPVIVEYAGAIVAHPDAKITSRYGMRFHPIKKEPAWHAGIDIGAPQGAKVKSPISGDVVFSGGKGAYGQVVEVAHSSGQVVRFAQLSKRKVSEGDTVAAGDVIGLVGQSGAATGPHLHFEWFRNGDQIDPESSGTAFVSDKARSDR